MHVSSPGSTPNSLPAKNGLPKNGLAKNIPPQNGAAKRMHSQDRHRQLLQVAMDVFARNGFGGTKTKDIARAAGVSEAILFHHFATKEDLYHAILDMKEDRESVAERHRELRKFMDVRDDSGLLRYFATTLLATFAADPAFQRLMLYASLEGHLLANLFRQRFVLPTGDLLSKYIARRQKEGAFRKCDPKVAAMFACGVIVHYAMSRHVFGMSRVPRSDTHVVEELVALVLGGLAQPGFVPAIERQGGTKLANGSRIRKEVAQPPRRAPGRMQPRKRLAQN